MNQDSSNKWEDKWVTVKKPWSWRKRLIIISAFVAIIISIGGFAGYSWASGQLDPPGAEGTEVLIDIPDGASINDITRILVDNEVVSNFTLTRFWWRNAGPYISGTYSFRENMSVNSAKQILDAGPIASFDLITLPEGLWLSDIEERLLANLPQFDPVELDAVLRGDLIRSRYQPADIKSLEGLLFGDTYQLDETGAADELGLVRRLVEKFDSVLDELNYDASQSKLGYTAYEVITVASMVEVEARVPEDRAKIARVIYNRLAADMKLEIDATVLYALGEHKSQLTERDLAVDSPYNTRRYKGLPPTPVSSPGRAALEAALNPAAGDWLFYVLADADGSHFFTSDYNEFLAQMARSREQGLL